MGCDMVEALDNKCPACGAKIEFNPLNQMWDCEYCYSKFTLEEMKAYKNASSDAANNIPVLEVKEEKVEEKVNTDVNNNNSNYETLKADVYMCRNCGAEIMADETVTATSCVYCGSTAILKDRIDDGRAPDLIIPFKTVKDQAVRAFSNLTKGKLLMPKEFKDITNIEKIQGVYVPFWGYDLLANGNVLFDAADVRRWSDTNYYYTETRKFEVEASGHFEYEKVLADASSRFNDNLMDSLEPFKYDALVSYNHAYLSGFLAEKYDVIEDRAFVRVADRTMNTCEALLKSRVKHQIKNVKNNKMEITRTATYYVMLPVWMVNVKYKDKVYTFAMNGQTGKMVGNIPIDTKKIILYSIAIFVACFLVLFGIYWLGASV